MTTNGGLANNALMLVVQACGKGEGYTSECLIVNIGGAFGKCLVRVSHSMAPRG